ncbi:MAG: F0F1 ATP synthase subunit A [Bacteroidales bacterium]|nr:MAG: F0F1 ATP synthase subunit A [Bacteroidales bacterium]
MVIQLFSPFEQFELFYIHKFCPYFKLSNYDTYGLLILVLSLAIFYLNVRFFNFQVFTPSRFQSGLEKLYTFIFDYFVYKPQHGFIAQQFFPLFFNLFILVLFMNLIGLVPYSFTLTSHIMLTFMLSFSVFVGLTIYIIIYKKSHAIQLFIPGGDVPKALIPFLFVVEVISYLSRTFSLAIRLFANMMSGHVLLHILTGFCAFLIADFGLVGALVATIPFALISAVFVLEIGIAFVQVYVFCILVSIYLDDLYSTSH